MSANPGGAVHDLGYRRYAGSRLPRSMRWRVILRHQLTSAWATWWRYKAWLAASVIATIALGAIVYAWQTQAVPMMERGGVKVPIDDALLASVPGMFRQIGFALTLTLGAGAIAADGARGAFTFYFSRSVRPIDYLGGKLVGLFALQAIVIAAPLVLLVLFRAGLELDGDALRYLALAPRALAIGLLGALVLAALPVGISALVGGRRNGIIAWAGYYFLIGGAVSGIGVITGSPVGAIDPATALESVAHAWLDTGVGLLDGRKVLPPAGWALVSLVVQTGVAIAIAAWKVRTAQQRGVVSGS